MLRGFCSLLYHHVGPLRAGTPPTLTVSPAQLERDVRWLRARGYRFVVPSEVERDPPASRAVMLTFDDGYADLADHAFPILERLGARASVFVVTERLGGRADWDDAIGLGAHRLLAADQLQRWSGTIEFGAHGRTHADLTTLSPDALEHEVRGSRDDLEQIIGAPVRSFAYPYGAWNEAVVACVRRHFAVALSTDEGINRAATPRHLIRRSMVYARDSVLDRYGRTLLGYSPIEHARRRLGRLARRYRIMSS